MTQLTTPPVPQPTPLPLPARTRRAPVPPVDELGGLLRAVYDQAATEPLPESMAQLLRELR